MPSHTVAGAKGSCGTKNAVMVNDADMLAMLTGDDGNRGIMFKTSGRGMGTGKWVGWAHRVNTPTASGGSDASRGKIGKTSEKNKGRGNCGGQAHRVNTPKASRGTGHGNKNTKDDDDDDDVFGADDGSKTY
eukprot:9982832-Karenia_brevis.AAC.1